MVVPNHIGDLQVLMIDRVILLNERITQCRLMVEVLSPATHSLMRPGQQGDCLAPPTTALLTTGDAALRLLQRAFGFAIPTRREDARAIGQGGERFYAKSIPVFCPVAGSDCAGTPAQEKQTYQPSASLLMVTVLGAPPRGETSARQSGQSSPGPGTRCPALPHCRTLCR